VGEGKRKPPPPRRQGLGARILFFSQPPDLSCGPRGGAGMAGFARSFRGSLTFGKYATRCDEMGARPDETGTAPRTRLEDALARSRGGSSHHSWFCHERDCALVPSWAGSNREAVDEWPGERWTGGGSCEGMCWSFTGAVGARAREERYVVRWEGGLGGVGHGDVAEVRAFVRECMVVV
jgi:hypothetical protein